MVTLDIIIVNWNSGNQLRDCLISISFANTSNFKISTVVVVDNASTDNSLIGLEEIPLPLKVIKNEENKGFAFACNQGAKNSKADYLLFLNPDTKLFQNSLVKPIEFMECIENNNVAAVGIQLVNEQGEVARTCSVFPKPSNFYSKILGLNKILPTFFSSHFMSQWAHNETRRVDHIIGAFYLIRRSVFEELSGFDERFFVYLEDLDLSKRIHQLGLSVYYYVQAQAYHKGGGTSEQVKSIRLFYSLRSRIQYCFKHFNLLSATMLMMATLFIEPISRVIFAIWHRSLEEAMETIKGFILLWVNIPTIFRKGNKDQ